MLKKIHVDQLRCGMYIREFCGSWMEHPFWRESFLLDDLADIRRIRESHIEELWIDTAKGIEVSPEAPAETAGQAVAAAEETLRAVASNARPPAEEPLEAEIRRAAAICSRAKSAVMSMFAEARMGKAVDTEAAGALVEQISSSVMRNPGALVSLARLKSADDYTYMHSVAVCALMVALARQMNLDEATMRRAGVAGLLHDIGKALTPLYILNKAGKLSDKEFEVMKRHTSDGYRMLFEENAVGEALLDACLHHHEKIDGSGYPDRQAGAGISLFARMCAVCDVYDAITSNRAYKPGWDPAESICKMAEWSKGHFDTPIFHAFVKSIGIYPVGSLVRLDSGRLGIVVGQTPTSLLKPRVQAFFSLKSQTHIPPQMVDLSHRACNDRIVGREDAAKWGFGHLDLVWAHAV